MYLHRSLCLLVGSTRNCKRSSIVHICDEGSLCPHKRILLTQLISHTLRILISIGWTGKRESIYAWVEVAGNDNNSLFNTIYSSPRFPVDGLAKLFGKSWRLQNLAYHSCNSLHNWQDSSGLEHFPFHHHYCLLVIFQIKSVVVVSGNTRVSACCLSQHNHEVTLCWLGLR